MESNIENVEDTNIQIENREGELKNEELKETNKLSKINLPKRKYAIIHGYSGHNYCGNQK